MACIILNGPLGERRVAENTPYRLLKGESISGVDWNCSEENHDEVDAELQRNGIMWGDAIEWAAKKLGIKQCAPCKARKAILNDASKNGWVATAKAIKATLE